jgi:nitrogen fixation NifU-like protein
MTEADQGPPAENKALPRFDDLYREVILDHYRRPRGRVHLECPDVENEGLNPVCGDEVKIALKFEGDRVKEVSVLGRGCAISTAAGSMLAEVLPGKTREEVELLTQTVKRMMHEDVDLTTGEIGRLDTGDLDALTGVKQFPVRVKCALLAWVTLAEALKGWGDAGSGDHNGGGAEVTRILTISPRVRGEGKP